MPPRVKGWEADSGFEESNDRLTSGHFFSFNFFSFS